MFSGKYQAVYKVKSPIKVAGVTQALDTYCSLNKKFANTKLFDLRDYKLNKSYYDRELSNFDMNMRVSDMSKILLKTAPKTAQSLVEMTVSSDPTKLDLVKDKRLEKRYINTLKKNGYDASIDIVDSFGGWEDNTYPTITFNDDKIEFVENRDRW